MSRWTEDQLRAIDTRQTNLLVSAGAGAGKTAVLVERIIRRIIDPNDAVDVDRLLVVTFTNAAALEMRERIGVALTQKLAENPLSSHVQRQLVLLGKASIQTLHSFCLDIVRQHFYLLGLDPAFRIADETETALMRVDVVDELLEKHYEDPDEAIMALVDGFGGRNSDQGLVNLILGLADFAQSQADPALWLQQICKGFEPEERTLEEMPWYEDVLSGVELLLQQAEKHLVTALQYSQTADGPASYEPLLLQEQETFGQLAIACKKFSWDELRSRIQGVLFHKLPASKGGDISLRAKTQHSRNAAKDIVNKLSKGYLAQTQTEVLQGLRASVPVVTKLVGLVLEYRQAFSAAKLHKGLVDFSDFEHMALRILYEEPSVCEELQARYAEVLVDEYQDVNGVQEAILQRVSRPNNRFMVGDVKQSIYRFRLAEPNLFIDKQKAYLSDANLGELIHLSHNFRSRPSVLNAVNFIFRQLMTSAYVGEVDYDTAAELRAGVAYPEGACTATAEVEMCLLDRTAGDHAAGEEDVDTEADAAIDSDEDLDHTAREAHFIAQTAKGLIEGGQFRVWDKATNSYRAVQYRDIVVLLRATRGRAETFVDVFRSFGLPVYADTSSGYFQTTEISVMLSVLHIIDNPRQDIPLAGVLRSPLFSFGAEDLAEIRLRGNSKDFWDCLRETAELDGSIAEKVQAFLGLYDNWRERARRGSLPLLIQRIYKDTGYYLYVGALPGGQQRQANLQSLYERSCQYEATSFRGLFRFLRFIERLQEQNGDLGAARSLGENEDVIRIMSIHKSKGLEFPVVFIAGMGNQFNLQDMRRPVLIHKQLGLGPQVVDLETRVMYPTLPRLAIERKMQIESLSEELRVLYVAMTRAREKLYLVGSVKKLAETLSKWQEMVAVLDGTEALPNDVMLSAKCFLDWLGPACFRHDSLSPSNGYSGPARFMLRDTTRGVVGDGAVSTCSSEFFASIKAGTALPDHGYGSEIRRRLTWAYPHGHASSTPVKVSVTELKGRQQVEESDYISYNPRAFSTRPFFVQERHCLTPTEIGTAMHMLMQHVDLKETITIDYLTGLRADMLKRNLLTEAEAEAIGLNRINQFFTADLGQRLLKSPKVWRELPFSLRIPANEIHPDVDGEHVYIQGVIDCLFEEGDGVVLVDFKNDNVSADGFEVAAGRYKVQIDLYARAIKELLKRNVQEAYVHFFVVSASVQVSYFGDLVMGSRYNTTSE